MTTNRKIKRNADKVAAKANTRVNKTKITQATVRADFAAYNKSEDDKDNAKARLRRDALQLTINDVSLAIEWLNQWDVYKSTTAGNDAQKKRIAAKAYFVDWFGIQRSSDAKSDIAKRAATETARAIEIVEECVAVHRLSYGDGFDFAEDGQTYLTRGSLIAEEMWTHMEYSSMDALTGSEYAKRYPSVLIQSRVNQVHPGQVAWADIRSLLMKKTGGRGKPPRSDAASKIDATKPLVGLRIFADTAKANAGAYATNTNKVETLNDAYAILKVAFNSPWFAAGWEHIDKGMDMWRTLLKGKVPTTPEKTMADAKGKDVIELFKRKADIISPPEAKSLPHPNGPAANATKK